MGIETDKHLKGGFGNGGCTIPKLFTYCPFCHEDFSRTDWRLANKTPLLKNGREKQN